MSVSQSSLAEQTSLVQRYLGLIRFSHTIFALPFALLTAWLAWSSGVPFRGLDLLGIVMCMVFARTAAMAFNRYADRLVDAANPRTSGRHIPTGLLSARQVLVFTLLNGAAFVASTLLFLPNHWPLVLSVPVLLFLLGYSYVKRFSMWAHYWLGAALMLSPLATWLALTGTLAWPPVALAGVIFFWVGGFDIIYACQDADFDQQSKLHSIPARFGISTALKIAWFSHLLTVVMLFAFWWFAQLGTVFLVGAIAISGLLFYEHRLVRPNDLDRVNVAFFNVNAVVSFGILAAGCADLLWSRI